MWRDALELWLAADNIPNFLNRADSLVGIQRGGLALIWLAGDDKAAAPIAHSALKPIADWE